METLSPLNPGPWIRCLDCGWRGKPERLHPGNGVLELFLWLFFLIPGMFYSYWRRTREYWRCPHCLGEDVIPAD